MNAAPSDARKSTAAATSAGVPARLDSVARHLCDRVSGQDIRHARAGVAAGDFQTNVLLHTDDGAVALAELLGSARPLLVVLRGAHERVLDLAKPWAAHAATPDGQLAGVLEEWFGAPGEPSP